MHVGVHLPSYYFPWFHTSQGTAKLIENYNSSMHNIRNQCIPQHLPWISIHPWRLDNNWTPDKIRQLANNLATKSFAEATPQIPPVNFQELLLQHKHSRQDNTIRGRIRSSSLPHSSNQNQSKPVILQYPR